MCGIAAIFAYGAGAEPVGEAELLAVRDAMTQRGPDGAGLWIASDRTIGLAHRRLAIIDTSPAGAQPMVFAPSDGGSAGAGYRITFNGEIYNYRALRTELEGQGLRFQTQSDTEVILHLYHRHGADLVHRLRGMFAFALWDERRGGLLLARDPLGIKPLYFADDGCALRVASQVKALLAGRLDDRAPDPAGHVGFFLFGSVPDPHTLYRGIRALPAGTTLWIGRDGRKVENRYFDLDQVLAGGAHPGPAPVLREALADSVRHHLVADVPVGVFLSAGLDSGTLVALAAAETGGGLETFTLGFREFQGRAEDEAPLAESVARLHGTRHRTLYVAAADFAAERRRLLAAMDQPSIDGVNVYFVARAAAGIGLKVALSGLGGDELFAGYDTFRQVPAMVRWIGAIPGHALLGRVVRAATARAVARVASPKYAGLLEYGGSYGGAYLLRRGLFMPWELPEVMDPDLARAGWRELQPIVRLDEIARPLVGDRRKMMALEADWYMRHQLLRDADWAGMAHGLEIRVPLVDAPLLAAVARLVRDRRGPDKRALAACAPKGLPAAVLARRKTGFAVPVRDWLMGDAPESSERGLRGWARIVHGAATAARESS